MLEPYVIPFRKPSNSSVSSSTPLLAASRPLVHFEEADSLDLSHSSSSSDYLEKKLRVRRLTLFLGCLIPFGAHYCKQSLPSLRPFFMEAGVSNSQFGLLLSATAWPNLFQPFLGGVFVDAKGHEQGAIVFTTLALIGHGLFATTLWPQGIRFDFTAVVARMIFGIGLGGAGVVQGALLGHYFVTDLSFAIGTCESVQHLASWLGRTTPPLIANALNHSFIASIWIGCLFLLVSCLCAVFHALRAELNRPFTFAGQRNNHKHRHFPEPLDLDGFNVANAPVVSSDYFKLSRRLISQLPSSFWAIGFLHFLFSNTTGLFAGFATSYFVEEFGMTPTEAAFWAGVDLLVPIFLSPIVGRFTDSYGSRLLLCTMNALFLTLAFGLFLKYGKNLWLGPLFPILLLSISTSSTPTMIKSLIPKVCPHNSLGTAFSIYLVFESLGASVGHAGLGYLRDLSPNYDNDFIVLMMITIIAFFGCLFITFYDRWYFNGILNSAFFAHDG